MKSKPLLISSENQTPSSKSDETRLKILETALGLFQRKGFDQTTLREIAEFSGMSLGSTYYYFRNKEEMIFAFYELKQAEYLKTTAAIFRETKDLKKRIQRLIEAKLGQLQPYRELLPVLFRLVADPRNPLSPFSSQTQSIRESSIEIFKAAFEDTHFKISKDLLFYLPRLFWLYQLGILLYWIHDESPDQKNSASFIEKSLGFLFRWIKISSFPLLRTARKTLIELLEAMIK